MNVIAQAVQTQTAFKVNIYVLTCTYVLLVHQYMTENIILDGTES